jgi:hypothetical protein
MRQVDPALQRREPEADARIVRVHLQIEPHRQHERRGMGSALAVDFCLGNLGGSHLILLMTQKRYAHG